MLLTIDIGNTNITLGLYEGKELGLRRLATAYDHMPDEYGLQLLGIIGACRSHRWIARRHLSGIRSPTPHRQDYRSLPALP